MERKIELTLLSSLEKLYNGDSVTDCDYSSFSILKNEKKSFQLAVETNEDFEGTVSVSSDLDNIRIYSVEMIKSDFPMVKNGCDDYFRISDDGYYPDLLLPLNGIYSFKKGTNVIWIEIDANGNCAGQHKVDVAVSDGENSFNKEFNVEIINAELDFKDFLYTCWFHTDCLMSYYSIEAFSEEYWRITENFLKTAREYGMNCVLTPLFTPPLDTEYGGERPTVQLVDVTVTDNGYSFNFDKLTRWIEMAKRCDVEHFELSHFFTQWGARCAPKIMASVNGEYKMIFGWHTKATSKEYTEFLKAFSVELKKYLEAMQLKDKVLIHVSDEPNFSMILPYSKASKIIHKLFKGYKIVDALSDYHFYKWKIVTNPIPASDAIEKFIGKTDNLWTYYCSSQHKKYVSNRFFCNSGLRTRVLGYQMFKYDVKGFLHWGYNFYYTQYSKALIDPYKVSDAGGKFPSGDSYVVYPAKDGTPYHSTRLKVFFDALQDMAALNTLSSLVGKDKALGIIEENGAHNITFSNYPHNDEWLLATREKVNAEIKKNL